MNIKLFTRLTNEHFSENEYVISIDVIQNQVKTCLELQQSLIDHEIGDAMDYDYFNRYLDAIARLSTTETKIDNMLSSIHQNNLKLFAILENIE